MLILYIIKNVKKQSLKFKSSLNYWYTYKILKLIREIIFKWNLNIFFVISENINTLWKYYSKLTLCFIGYERKIIPSDIHPKRVKTKYFCLSCAYSTVQKCHIDKHVRIHTKERPFICPECQKGFYAMENLRSHMVTHRMSLDWHSNWHWQS